MAIREPIVQTRAAPIRRGVQLFRPTDVFTGSEAGLALTVEEAVLQGRIWQDSAGTTRANKIDDPVGRVDDLSGNGNNLTQSTAAARPLLKQDGNGIWYLQFDGTDDELLAGSIFGGDTDVFTLVTAMRFDESGDTVRSASLGGSGSPSSGNFDQAQDASLRYDGSSTTGTLPALSAGVVYIRSSDRDGTIVNDWVNQNININAATRNSVLTVDNYRPGRKAPNDHAPQMAFYGGIAINRVLSQAERKFAEDYLNRYARAY